MSGPNLRQFSRSEIYISDREAWAVLKFFWPQCTLKAADITEKDISFAQALLVEAIDASYAMGYAHIIFDVFYMKIPGSFTDVGKLIKEFAKKAAKHWFKHLGAKGNLANAEIYSSVRTTLSNNFKSVIEIRQQTGELIY
jgi:hypothetical protein